MQGGWRGKTTQNPPCLSVSLFKFPDVSRTQETSARLRALPWTDVRSSFGSGGKSTRL
jgi:hypothetical protein